MTLNVTHLFYLIFNILVVVAKVNNNSEDFLYESVPSVTELNDESFSIAVKFINKPFVIIFYAPWCWHCRNYVPTYSSIAKDFGGEQVSFKSLNCEKFSRSCDILEVNAYPTIMAYGFVRGEKIPLRFKSNEESEIRELLRNYIKNSTKQGKTSSNMKSSSHETLPRKETKDAWITRTVNVLARQTTPEKRLSDALTSLQFMLENEFLANISERKIGDLIEFLTILTKFLPHHRRSSYERLLAKLHQLRSLPMGTVEKRWHDVILNEIDLPLGTRNEKGDLGWFVCGVPTRSDSTEIVKGAHAVSSSTRGYTCGLWLLFHFMTVAGAKVNVESELVRAHGTKLPAHTTGKVMDAIRLFVSEFFRCDGCRTHFLKAYSGCEFGRCEVSSHNFTGLQVWLWRFHNSVTERIFAEQPDSQPGGEYALGNFVAWPRKECPLCGSDDSWNFEEIEKFLHKSYWDLSWLENQKHQIAGSNFTIQSPDSKGALARLQHSTADFEDYHLKASSLQVRTFTRNIASFILFVLIFGFILLLYDVRKRMIKQRFSWSMYSSSSSSNYKRRVSV